MTSLTRRSLGAIAASAFATPAFAQQAAPAPAPAPSDDRAGYLFVMAATKKRDIMAEYAKTLPPIYQKFQGYYIATGNKNSTLKILEGTMTNSESIVLARFPAIETVNEFWWSPEYRKSAQLRIDGDAATVNVVRLKGRPGEGPRPVGKPGILIGIQNVRDPAKLREYGAKAGPLVGQYGGKIIAGGQRKDIELLEGNFGNNQINVVRFPSIDALRKFYNDPAYQEAIKIRQAGADALVLEVEGTEFKG